MRLNRRSKDELRKLIEEELKKVPNGYRIHLDKELLEDLLFETTIYDREKGYVLKLPIWTGEFLSKLDLSDVSFEDVAWSLRLDENEIKANYYDLMEIMQTIFAESLRDGLRYSDFEEFVKKTEIYRNFRMNDLYRLKHNEKITFRNTNAHIDFQKSWESKHYWGSDIVNCDFSFTDLSNNCLDDIVNVSSSNLSNTNIKVTEISGLSEIGENKYSSEKMDTIDRTDLSGLDLSEITLYASEFSELRIDEECDISNTKIKIINDSIERLIEAKKQNDENFISIMREAIKRFIQFIKKGYLDGCYIDGKLIVAESQKQEIISALGEFSLSDYDKFKNEVFNSVVNTINEQVGKLKK